MRIYFITSDKSTWEYPNNLGIDKWAFLRKWNKTMATDELIQVEPTKKDSSIEDCEFYLQKNQIVSVVFEKEEDDE